MIPLTTLEGGEPCAALLKKSHGIEGSIDGGGWEGGGGGGGKRKLLRKVMGGRWED
jgi:hypothetical protein